MDKNKLPNLIENNMRLLLCHKLQTCHIRNNEVNRMILNFIGFFFFFFFVSLTLFFSYKKKNPYEEHQKNIRDKQSILSKINQN